MIRHVADEHGRALSRSADPHMSADRARHPLSAIVQLHGDVAEFKLRVETGRLALFNRCLRRLVTKVSPLLLDLAKTEDFDLHALVAKMEPPYGWPWRTVVPIASPRAMFLKGSARMRKMAAVNEDRVFRRRMSQLGMVIRPPSHPDGRLGVHVVGDTLSMVVDLGPHRLATTSGGALLCLDVDLPETLVAGLIGVRLGDLIQHPLLGQKSYEIDGVEETDEGLLLISFRTDEEPFEMPSIADDVAVF